jgi:hypothetical protein
MNETSSSTVPLQATFRLKLVDSSEPLTIKTVGEAYRFVSNDGVVEWIEVYGLRKRALEALRAASHNAMLSRRATDAVRALLAGAKLL